MKPFTNAQLTEQLNSLAHEHDSLIRRVQAAEGEAQNLREQLSWHKRTNQQLLEILLMGAKEGSWPRSVKS